MIPTLATVLPRADALGYADELRWTAQAYRNRAAEFHRKALTRTTPGMTAAYFCQEREMIGLAERTDSLAAFWDETMRDAAL